MKRTTRSFEIADPFYTALETMSREMNVDRDTLVNQALFALARLHGFIVPTVISLDTSPGVAEPIKPPPPVPEMEITAPRRAVSPAPAQPPEATQTRPEVPISSTPTSVAPSLATEPVASTSIAESPVKPAVDLAALRAVELERMAKIAEDVDSMVVPVEPPEEEEEENEEDDDEASDSDDEDDSDDDESGDDESSDDDEADEPANSGESPAAEDEEDKPSEDESDEDDDDEPAEDQDEEDGDDDDGDADAPADRDAEPPAPTPATTSHDDVEPTVDRTVMVRPSTSIKVWVQADEGGEVLVAPGRFVIGRGDNCNLVIDSLRVSREHASVQLVGKEVIIEDLGSSNGTWYNGEKVERRLVVNGDEIVLGNERVRFRIEG